MGKAAATAAQSQASSFHSQAAQLWLPSSVSPSGAVPQPASTCPSIRAARLAPPLRASKGRDVCVSPTAWARLCCQHNTPGHAFHQLRRWKREFHSSLPDRCTLHFDPRNLPFVCVNSNQRVDLSGSLYVWRCACVCLQLSPSDEPSHESRNASTSKQNYHHKPVIAASKMPASAKSGGVSSYTQELSCCRCVVRPARGSALATNTQCW